MPASSSFRSLSRAITVVLISLCGIGTLVAQEQEGDVVYRFSLKDITDPGTAKPLQYALLEDPSVSFFDFIDECDCFKLAMHATVDYATLKNMLHAHGYELIGDVEVSNGSTLRPPDPGSVR